MLNRGTKRICQNCSAKFYDLSRSPIVCPRCKISQKLLAGANKCENCKLRISIMVEEPRCSCGYQLYHLESNNCPECGKTVPESDRWAAESGQEVEV